MQETYTGKGLFPGEAYAPNAPSLVEAAAKAPAPEGAYLLKLANEYAPGGAPQVESSRQSLHPSLPTRKDSL